MLKQQHYTLTNVKKVKSQSTTLKGGVFPRRRRSELAELPGELIEREIKMGQGGETGGGFHATGENWETKNFSKMGKINGVKRRCLRSCSGQLFCHVYTGTKVRGDGEFFKH